MGTPFTAVYNRFLGKITDDMYMELTPQDTLKDLQNILIDAIPYFEFPRKVIDDYTLSQVEKPISSLTSNDFIISQNENIAIVDNSVFTAELTSEEINILAILMMINWTQRQVTSIEHTRMKYTGTDFKMTSQANHLSKLLSLLEELHRQSHHMQRLYKRRRLNSNGQYESNWSIFGSSSGERKRPNKKPIDEDDYVILSCGSSIENI